MNKEKVIPPVSDQSVIAMNQREKERVDLGTLRNEGKKKEAVNSGVSEDSFIEDFYDKMFRDDLNVAVPITADDDKSDAGISSVYEGLTPQKPATNESQLADGSDTQINEDCTESRNTEERNWLVDFLTCLLKNNTRRTCCVAVLVALVLAVVIWLYIAIALKIGSISSYNL